jgi:uncharacterized protein
MSSRLVAVFRGEEKLFSRVKLAGSFWLRLRGLMFYRTMPAIDGLLLYPCSSVHMFWMWFPLDLVYLDREGKVLWVEEGLRPNRVGPGVKGAFYVLEANEGTVGRLRIKIGDRLSW